jgi:hypothetical protein
MSFRKKTRPDVIRTQKGVRLTTAAPPNDDTVGEIETAPDKSVAQVMAEGDALRKAVKRNLSKRADETELPEHGPCEIGDTCTDPRYCAYEREQQEDSASLRKQVYGRDVGGPPVTSKTVPAVVTREEIEGGTKPADAQTMLDAMYVPLDDAEAAYAVVTRLGPNTLRALQRAYEMGDTHKLPTPTLKNLADALDEMNDLSPDLAEALVRLFA